jgi:diguanylate cyclase (GGDEF)-like protein
MRVTIRDLEDWVRPRTVTILTLILLAALWSVVIASAVSGRQASIASTGELLQRTGRAVEEQTHQQLRLTDVLLATAAHWLQANPGRDPRSDPAFRKLLEGFRARTGDSIDIQLLAIDGGVFDVLDKTPRPLPNVADSEYFKGALASKALFIGRPERSQRSGGHGLPIALSLPHPIHGIQMIVALVDLPTLIGKYEGQRQQAGGEITLLRSDGVVLARAPEDAPLLGQSIADGRLFGERLRQPPRTLLLLDGTSAGEKRAFVSYSPVGDFPLLIAVSEDYDEALLPWLKQTMWIVLLALGVTVPLTIVAVRSLRLLQALANRNAELQHLVTTDPLTGSSSRQHFVETLADELGRAQRQKSPLTLLLLAVDFFKQINDGYGHAIGDQVLIACAQAATGCLRSRDLIGRLGGGEFSILLPNTETREAIMVAERVRTAIARISIPTDNGTVEFAASVGASQARTEDRSIDDLLKRAATALHNAKAGGHDRVAVV